MFLAWLWHVITVLKKIVILEIQKWWHLAETVFQNFGFQKWFSCWDSALSMTIQNETLSMTRKIRHSAWIRLSMTVSSGIMLSDIIPTFTFLFHCWICCAECCYAGCHYAECRGTFRKLGENQRKKIQFQINFSRHSSTNILLLGHPLITSITIFAASGLFYKNIMIVNDTFRVESEQCHIWRHLQSSIKLLESSIMLEENIYSTGIPRDNLDTMIVICL